MNDEDVKNFKRLLRETSEADVKKNIVMSVYGEHEYDHKVRLARLYLSEREEAREAERQRAADDRSAAAVQSVRESNRIAKISMRIAVGAFILAILAYFFGR